MANILGEIHVEKIEKANLRAIDEGGTRGRRAAPAADDRRTALARRNRWRDRLGDLRRLAVDRTKCAAERIEHQPLHGGDRARRQFIEGNIRGKLGEPLRFGHPPRRTRAFGHDARRGEERS